MTEDIKKYFKLLENATVDKSCNCEGDCHCEDDLLETYDIHAEGEHKARIEDVIEKIESAGSDAETHKLALKALEAVGGETFSSTPSGAIEDLLPIIEEDKAALKKVEELLDQYGVTVSEDVDAELEREIEDAMDDEEDYPGDLGVEVVDAPSNEEDEEDETEEVPVFNYTATIQLHGYDYPLILQSDDMDELKTVMRVLRQSGLNPEGQYKWNSRAINLDPDEE